MAQKAQGQPLGRALKVFYLKRLLRIYPLYVLFIVFGVAVTLLWGHYSYLRQIPWLLTGTYNFYAVLPSTEYTGLFGHYWSLSVEEQFYAFFPLAFLRLERRPLILALASVILFCPLLRYWEGQSFLALTHEPAKAADAVYEVSLGQFDSIAVGCLLALLETRIVADGRRWVAGLVALCAVAVIAYLGQIYASMVPGETWHDALRGATNVDVFGGFEVSLYSVLSLLSGLVVVLILTGSRVTDLIFNRPLPRLVGRLSYAIYICHYPLLELWQRYVVPLGPGRLHKVIVLVPYLSLVAVVSWVIHRRVEAPFLKLKHKILDHGEAHAAAPTMQAAAAPQL